MKIKVINLLFFVILALNTLTLQEKQRYDGYHLLKLFPQTPEQLKIIDNLHNNDPEFDIWHIHQDVDVLLSQNAFNKYTKLFDKHQIGYKVIDNNIQNKIDEEETLLEQKNKLIKSNNAKISEKYARYAEMSVWLDGIVLINPSYMSSYVAGKSFEGRDIKVIKFKTSTTQRSLYFDCGIHAREWIAPSTCIWLIENLVKDYNTGNPLIKEILDYYEIHIIPLVNPDGYEYTHTTSRLWRKSRTIFNGTTCIGTDLNRNFPFKWMVAGASNNPCSDTYAGPAPSSEKETQAVQSVVNSKLGQWDSFTTIHSYGQYFLTPWGYTLSLPDAYENMKSLGIKFANAVYSVYGTKFNVGSSTELLAYASGSSRDWAHGSAGINYSYTLELRPGDSSPDASFGFILPPDRIPLVGNEIYNGLKTFIKELKDISRK